MNIRMPSNIAKDEEKLSLPKAARLRIRKMCSSTLTLRLRNTVKDEAIICAVKEKLRLQLINGDIPAGLKKLSLKYSWDAILPVCLQYIDHYRPLEFKSRKTMVMQSSSSGLIPDYEAELKIHSACSKYLSDHLTNKTKTAEIVNQVKMELTKRLADRDIPRSLQPFFSMYEWNAVVSVCLVHIDRYKPHAAIMETNALPPSIHAISANEVLPFDPEDESIINIIMSEIIDLPPEIVQQVQIEERERAMSPQLALNLFQPNRDTIKTDHLLPRIEWEAFAELTRKKI